ncbi:MAG: hypothetical protein K2I28_01255 [Muribaculaceae bacterium]|nr:hypothetical protein [Muribaculaceae bacterium]
MLEPGKVKIAVATVIKPHGIKGELNIELGEMAEPDDDFAPGACLIVEIDGLDVPYFVASSRPRGSESMLLTLDDVDSETEAALLAGRRLYVYADPEEAEGLTAGDLVGYSIVDSASRNVIGRIDELTELTPGAWYFDLGGRLIPAVDEFIDDVDHDSHTVAMTLPEGLLEL